MATRGWTATFFCPEGGWRPDFPAAVRVWRMWMGKNGGRGLAEVWTFINYGACGAIKFVAVVLAKSLVDPARPVEVEQWTQARSCEAPPRRVMCWHARPEKGA